MQIVLTSSYFSG